jgi:hypothetical protein
MPAIRQLESLALNTCKICKTRMATVPEGEERARYCENCWDNRLRQLYQAADNFRAERVFRTADSEKYFIFHSSVKEEDGFCAVVFCLHDPYEDHLDVTAYLLDVLKWEDTVPIIYEEGVESEVELMDVFLWFLEGDVIRSWRAHSWSAEVSHCSQRAFWIDSRESESSDESEDEERGEGRSDTR